MRLQVISDDNVLIDLIQTNGVICIKEVSKDLKPAVERWLEYGLTELIGIGIDIESRTTPSSNPKFLPRLANYLERQFSLKVELNNE